MDPLSLDVLKTDYKKLDDKKFLILFNAILIHAGTFMAANLALFNQGQQDVMSDRAMTTLVNATLIIKAFSDECDRRGLYDATTFEDTEKKTPSSVAKKSLH